MATGGNTSRLSWRGEAMLRLMALPCALATAGTAAASAALAESSQTSLWPVVAALVGAGLTAWLVFLAGRPLRGLGALASALDAAAAGARDPGALRLAEGLGARARAFNSMIDELAAQRRGEMIAKVGESSSKPARRDADMTSACDAMWSGVMLVDAQGRVKYANGAAAILLSCVREKLVGASLHEVIRDGAVIDAVLSAARGETRVRAMVEAGGAGADAQVGGEKGAGGGAPESVTRFSIRTVGPKEQPLAMVIVEDVTQQRVADRSRNAFIAQATHELRTPLTNMRLCLDELLESPDLEAEERQRFVNIVSGESRRLERMVGDMLSISEIEAGTLTLHMGDARLGQLIDDLRQDFQMQAKDKEIKLAFNVPPKLPVIHADRDKLVLTLGNLIGNALKYTPSGGDVTVTIKTPAGQLLVDVTDSGIGIAPEEQELVFERFYRSKDQRVEKITGTGLGLALARQVARLHGGDITISSQLNKGSTFTLSLPTGAPATESKAA
ncbi:MAG: PAS domain-containing protein [Phycisphaerales bacterium]|nr:PAS domain-containing protein [Phycisphaerales bacterium]